MDAHGFFVVRWVLRKTHLMNFLSQHIYYLSYVKTTEQTTEDMI